jgi:hypothetical protein
MNSYVTYNVLKYIIKGTFNILAIKINIIPLLAAQFARAIMLVILLF